MENFSDIREETFFLRDPKKGMKVTLILVFGTKTVFRTE